MNGTKRDIGSSGTKVIFHGNICLYTVRRYRCHDKCWLISAIHHVFTTVSLLEAICSRFLLKYDNIACTNVLQCTMSMSLQAFGWWKGRRECIVHTQHTILIQIKYVDIWHRYHFIHFSSLSSRSTVHSNATTLTYNTICICTYASKSAFICTFCKMINEREREREKSAPKTITTLEIINFELISKLPAISFTGSMILFCLRIIIRIVINLHKPTGKFVVQTNLHTLTNVCSKLIIIRLNYYCVGCWLYPTENGCYSIVHTCRHRRRCSRPSIFRIFG